MEDYVFGVHFALSDDDRDQLFDVIEAKGDVLAFATGLINRWDEEWLCHTSTEWDILHRCLTNGYLTEESSTPLHWCMLGGKQIPNRDNEIVTFVNNEDVKAVAAALDEIDQSWLRQKYDALDRKDMGCWADAEEEFNGIVWDEFIKLQAFFHKVAEADRAVLFTVDCGYSKPGWRLNTKTLLGLAALAVVVYFVTRVL